MTKIKLLLEIEKEAIREICYFIVRTFSKKAAREMLKKEMEHRNEKMKEYLEERRKNLEERLKAIDEEEKIRLKRLRVKHSKRDRDKIDNITNF